VKRKISTNEWIAFLIAIPAYYFLWRQTGITATIAIAALFFAHNLDKHWMR
jgi:hypothetical protein